MTTTNVQDLLNPAEGFESWGVRSEETRRRQHKDVQPRTRLLYAVPASRRDGPRIRAARRLAAAEARLAAISVGDERPRMRRIYDAARAGKITREQARLLGVVGSLLYHVPNGCPRRPLV